MNKSKHLVSRNLENPNKSSSGFDLDPDPLADDIEVLHGSTRNRSGNAIEQFFSSMLNAARLAFKNVLSRFFYHSVDADPVIDISKPRYLRRNEDNLTHEMKVANDVARNDYYAKIFKGVPLQVGRVNVENQLPDSASSSKQQVLFTSLSEKQKSHGMLSTASWSENSNYVETAREDQVESSLNITTFSNPPANEPSIGETSFQQFFKLYKEKKGAIEFTPGYVSFTPECLAYARQLAESAVGKNVSKMSNAEEINAAKALIEGDHSHRIAQEQTVAGEVLKQEKIKKQELEKAKLPGQPDFEDFFTMYLKHKDADTKLVISAGSKFLTDECINYAKSILGPPEPTNAESSEKVLAERFLSTWRANPAASLAQANSSEKFQMPPALPPPVARVRPGTAQVPTPLPSWETAALDLQSLSDAEIDNIASISSISPDKLKQAFKGLRLVSIASTKKDATIVEGGTSQRAGFRSRWPDSSSTAIDDLQEAQYWLKKIKGSDIEKLLEAYPKLKAILQSSQRISEVIEEQLSLLAPVPKKATVKPTSKLEPLSAEELRRAEVDFDKYVISFTRAINNTKSDGLYSLSDPKYLTRGNVAIAQKIVDEAPNLDVKQTDDPANDIRVTRQNAAAFLVNQANKLANKGETTKGGQ